MDKESKEEAKRRKAAEKQARTEEKERLKAERQRQKEEGKMARTTPESESIFEEMMEGDISPVEIDEEELARQALAMEHEEDPIIEEIIEEEVERLLEEDEAAEEAEPATAPDVDLADEAAGPESIFEEMMEGEVTPVDIGVDDLTRQALAAVPEDDIILEEVRAEEAGPAADDGGEITKAGEEEAGETGEEEAMYGRFRQGLSKSRRSWVNPLSRAMANRRFDDDFWEEVENILIGADVGVEMTLELVTRLRERIVRDKIKDPAAALQAFREEIEASLIMEGRPLQYAPEGPSVWLIVGVNGVGKTTTIAKLAYMLRSQGGRVLLAAGDTFRAAGIEQLEIWGDRVGVHTVKHRPGADAAAVAFDAVQSARAREMNVVIVDTAGRLHTKVNLMEELKKIKRVAGKEAQVTETILVLDATTGQNGLQQAKLFQEAIELTGVALTKLDGTAKGGIVIAIQRALGIPIKLIGVGEKMTDLYAFDPAVFAAALFARDPD
jgi:fused signal recognition particle receptor